ncbi:VanW family protein [Microcoleus sp. FACHB-672]|uniref:VanW family protein n=1 Tax=Microcoleus sp. FACHB-672 TaxID=2692825 RepID=UPI00168A044A|nr:VanW family protein [Microcoleus sp. FACHB-672]MBD2040148.1 VanW family protein [Microcoleus sp. FACHB-672]
MKNLLPPRLRLYIKICHRKLIDAVTGRSARFVSYSNHRVEQGTSFNSQIVITQPIYSNEFSANKIHNLKLAIQQVDNLTIQPGEILSFWHLVGNPNKSRGYVIGRTLVQNELKASYGGGLCQLSGLLYLLALKAGLSVLERASHSQDIYTDKTRFAPLGSDATVVYGYKDLRLQNNLLFPICFRFQVQENAITAMLCAAEPILEYRIEFIHQPLADGVRVDTVRYELNNFVFQEVATAIYKIQPVPQKQELQSADS